MGRDKALLEVHGRPLAARVADALRDAGAAPVLAVGGDLAGLAAVGLDAIPDPEQGSGPLAGIATALRDVPGPDVVVVLACDLVGADPDAVRAVTDALHAAPGALAAVPVADGRPQPLHAAWRRAALGEVERRLAAGDLAVRAVLDALPVVLVEGLRAEAFRNANSPADLGTD
jgi:molybdenum cofactor guanylyltransferase